MTATNTVLTPTRVTKEIGVILHNNLRFVRNTDLQYDKSNSVAGQMDGGTIKLRVPNKYTTSTTVALSEQNTTEASVTLTRGTQRHVDMSFTTEELSQKMDDFSGRVLKPAISVLASMIDYDAASMAESVWNSVGTPGTTPATALVALQAGAKLSNFACPSTQRYMCVDPNANAYLVDGLKGLFIPADKIGAQFKEGVMGVQTLGFEEWAWTQSIRNHTTGSGVARTTIAVNEPSGTKLTEGTQAFDIDGGTTTDTLKVGDVFTLPSVYAVNPETKQSTGQLMQFVVDNNTTESSGAATGGTGTGNFHFSPPIYTASSGALQNVTAMPANNDILTFLGSASTAYPQNIAFHKNAFVFATTDLMMPDGVHFAAREVMDNISIRIVRQYRIGTDDIPARCDVLYGYVMRQGELACRVWG